MFCYIQRCGIFTFIHFQAVRRIKSPSAKIIIFYLFATFILCFLLNKCLFLISQTFLLKIWQNGLDFCYRQVMGFVLILKWMI